MSRVEVCFLFGELPPESHQRRPTHPRVPSPPDSPKLGKRVFQRFYKHLSTMDQVHLSFPIFHLRCLMDHGPQCPPFQSSVRASDPREPRAANLARDLAERTCSAGLLVSTPMEVPISTRASAVKAWSDGWGRSPMNRDVRGNRTHWSWVVNGHPEFTAFLGLSRTKPLN